MHADSLHLLAAALLALASPIPPPALASSTPPPAPAATSAPPRAASTPTEPAAPLATAARPELARAELPTSFAIEHVRVLPMDSERERVLDDQTLFVRGGRIEALGKDVALPEGVLRIDGRGKFALPGLADMHCHLLSDERIDEEFAGDEFELLLALGLTTIRDPIGKPAHLKWRQELAAGERRGPRLCVGSPQLTARKWPEPFLGRQVTTPDEVRAAVRDFKLAGYDFVKLTFFLTPELFAAAVQESRAQGLRVVGHVGTFVPLQDAIAAHMQLEHLDGWFEALVPSDAPRVGSVSSTDVWQAPNWESLDWLDAKRILPLARRCADERIYSTPTLSFLNTSFGTGRSDEELRASPEWGFVSDEVRRELLDNRARFWEHPPSKERRARYVELRNQITRTLGQVGAKLMAGSDAPEWMLLGGFALHRELESLVAAGLSPYAALAAATRVPHEWLGDLAELGTLERGKQADILLLDADPLAAIGNTRAIAGVAWRGRWLERAELERMLAAARRRLSKAPLRKS